MPAKLSHCWRKPGSPLLYFRRRVPDNVKPLLAAAGSSHAGKSHVVVSLKTTDPKVAAPRIARLVKQTDDEWKALRNPTRAAVLHQAHQLLERHGVDPFDPKGDEGALGTFLAAMEDQLPHTVREDSALGYGPRLDPHLSPVFATALQVAQDRREFTLGDCHDQYVAARPQTAKTAGIAFRYLRAYLGKDKDVRKVRRAAVNGFVSHLLEGGHAEDGAAISTSTVGRYLGTLKAAFGRAIRENELGIENVFARVEIPRKGEDVVERETFTVEQYRCLYRAIDHHAETRGLDQIRCILILVAETGARLAEIVGLAIADVHAGDKIPSLDIRDHGWRQLKTRSSIRKVPLSPKALHAAQTAIRQAHGSPFLFPRYTSETGTRANAASVTLVEWIRSRDGLRETRLGNHSLRHGMEDLLRAVGCPDSVRDQILGHKTPGMGASYGRGYPLAHLAEWLASASAAVRHLEALPRVP